MQFACKWLESIVFHYLTLMIELNWSSISSSDQVNSSLTPYRSSERQVVGPAVNKSN